MSDLLIKDVDEELCGQLKSLARAHGRSVADEVRDILRVAVASPQTPVVDHTEGRGTRIARRFAGQGLDFEIAEWRFGTGAPGDLQEGSER
jgi:plasmid stability protein